MKNNIIILLITFLLGGISEYLIINHKPENLKQYWEDSNFKTDTIIHKIPYSLPSQNLYHIIPPKSVLVYYHDTLKLSVNCDSLIKLIDSLGNVVKVINKSYLSLFPDNPKLLYGKFTSDTLRLDLLKTNGDIYSDIFLVDYSRFKYQWIDGKISTREIPKVLSSPKKSLLVNQIFLYGGYSINQKYPIIGGSYLFGINRFVLAGEINLPIQKIQNPEILGKVGYLIR